MAEYLESIEALVFALKRATAAVHKVETPFEVQFESKEREGN